jgi:GNAT superfamily N-acetyltransferase
MDIDLSWDPARLQFDRIHQALAASYWSPGVRRDIVERAAANSLTLGAYNRATGEQVGYARVITDRATYAYLCDVIVFEEHRGQGIGKAIVEAAITHPDLGTIRNFALGTRDAHSLYERHGFEPVPDCTKRMEKKGRAETWQER